MAKHKYEVRHLDDGSGVVEIQHHALEKGIPPARNVYLPPDEATKHKHKHGRTYLIDPEKLDAEAEEVIAEQQSEQIQAQAEEMKPKRGAKKSAGK